MTTPVDQLLDLVEWEALPAPVNVNDLLPYATHRGVLVFMGSRLTCYQLSNGKRIIDADDLQRCFNDLGLHPVKVVQSRSKP